VSEFLDAISCYCERKLCVFNACLSGGLIQGENPSIIVSTPTKFVALVESQGIEIKETLESLVVDEADLILSFGYQDDLEKIQTMLPKVYQSFLFSATMTTVLALSNRESGRRQAQDAVCKKRCRHQD
jgi:ATP-dependent RNA helicase DDX56/DBP9